MKVVSDNDNALSLPAGAAFHERIAAKWSQGYSHGGFQRRLECFRSIFQRNIGTGQAWLDLGCGSGVLTKELIRLGATVVVGVDGSPAMLEHAASTVIAPSTVDLSWMRGDVQAIPFLSAESFDGILCSSVIEYVDRPDAVLREIARILRPGGNFIVSLPPKFSFVRTTQKAVRRLARYLGKDVFSYLSVSRFEADSSMLPKLFGDAGLSISRVTKFDPLLPTFLIPLLRPSLLVIEGRKSEK